jgi:hypothetical protein
MLVRKSIDRRLRELERRVKPKKWDLRRVSTADLKALERVLSPAGHDAGDQPKVPKRILRLIAKLEANAR